MSDMALLIALALLALNLIVLIALELWFMYRQASRAAKAEATRAKLAGHKNLEHADQSAQTGKDNTGKHDDDAVSARRTKCAYTSVSSVCGSHMEKSGYGSSPRDG